MPLARRGRNGWTGLRGRAVQAYAQTYFKRKYGGVGPTRRARSTGGGGVRTRRAYPPVARLRTSTQGKSEFKICIPNRSEVFQSRVLINKVDKVSYWDITPTNEVLFPWLANIAKNYQYYYFKKLKFEFRTTSGASTNNASPAIGKIVMAIDEDFNYGLTPSRAQLEDLAGSSGGPPYGNFACSYNTSMTAQRTRPVKRWFTFPPAVTAQTLSDKRLEQVGRLFLLTGGSPVDASVAGELWVTYSVCFSRARLQRTGELHFACAANPDPTQPLTPAQYLEVFVGADNTHQHSAVNFMPRPVNSAASLPISATSDSLRYAFINNNPANPPLFSGMNAQTGPSQIQLPPGLWRLSTNTANVNQTSGQQSLWLALRNTSTTWNPVGPNITYLQEYIDDTVTYSYFNTPGNGAFECYINIEPYGTRSNPTSTLADGIIDLWGSYVLNAAANVIADMFLVRLGEWITSNLTATGVEVPIDDPTGSLFTTAGLQALDSSERVQYIPGCISQMHVTTELTDNTSPFGAGSLAQMPKFEVIDRTKLVTDDASTDTKFILATSISDPQQSLDNPSDPAPMLRWNIAAANVMTFQQPGQYLVHCEWDGSAADITTPPIAAAGANVSVRHIAAHITQYPTDKRGATLTLNVVVSSGGGNLTVNGLNGMTQIPIGGGRFLVTRIGPAPADRPVHGSAIFA